MGEIGKTKTMCTEYSLEGLVLKLKLQYFGHLMQRANSLEKTLMLGKIEELISNASNEWNYLKISFDYQIAFL